MISFNLNDDILFRPTELGLEYLCEYYNRFVQLSGTLKLKTIDEYKNELNKDGYYRLHFWEFMNIFGKVSYMGSKQYYEMNVFVEKTL